MPITWDNPRGYDLIVTRCCSTCGGHDVRTLWSRPWKRAGKDFAARLEETPLTMPDIAGMLGDAPFVCQQCGGSEGRLVAMSVDLDSIDT